MHHQKTAFENIVGKEEIAHDKQFLFPQRFSTQPDNCTIFVHISDIISFFAAELERPEIGISGEGLNLLNNPVLQIIIPRSNLLYHMN